MKGERHLKMPENTPMANLLMAILDKAGVPTESVGDSTGGSSCSRSTAEDREAPTRRVPYVVGAGLHPHRTDTMQLRHLLASCIAVVIAAGSITAAGSDTRIADTVRNRDKTNLRALLKQRLDVNAPDAEGMTALHWAAHWDDVDTARLLLRAGANAKAANRYGVTPLHEASTVGNVAIVEALLKAGADPNAAFGDGETALMTAARTGSVETVKMLLTFGANVNAREAWRGQTALMWAAAENHAAVVKLLIELRADVNARSIRYDFPKLTGGNGGIIHDRSEGGLTAIFFAARQGAIEAAEILVDAGRRPARRRGAVRLHADADRDLQRPLRSRGPPDRQRGQRQRRIAVHRDRNAQPGHLQQSSEPARHRRAPEQPRSGRAPARARRRPEWRLLEEDSSAAGTRRHRRAARRHAAVPGGEVDGSAG